MKGYKRESVDVIICCYNQEQYISQAVESVIQQKVDADVRVLIADDCSTDNTLNIIKSYEKQSPFPFVYLPSSKNIGLSANYHRAFDNCFATYTAILEGDDWWSKDSHLAQHIQFLQNHKRYSMSYNRITVYLQDKGITEKHHWPFGNIDYVAISLKEQISLGNQIGNLSCCVFRTEMLHCLPKEFYALKYADWELGIMMAMKGPIAMLKDSTSTYRINQNGLWSRLAPAKKQASEIQSLERIQPLLPDYCVKYIDTFKKTLTSGAEFSIPMPRLYRLKRMLFHRRFGKK